LANLRTSAALRWVGDLDQAEAALAEAVEVATDGLYELIGKTDRGVGRKHLVELRRNLHNGRYDRARDNLDRAPVRVQETAAALAEPVFAAAKRLKGLAEIGEKAYQNWLLEERRGLGNLLEEDDFARGIAVAAPAAAKDFLRYQKASVTGDALTKNQRKAERSLLQYALRTAAKTSPFSSLTRVALVRCADGAARDDSAETQTVDVSRPSVYPICIALDALGRDEDAILPMRVMIAPIIAEEMDNMIVVYRSEYDFSEATGEADQASVVESLVRIEQGQLCRIVKDAYEAGHRTVATLVGAMVELGITRKTALGAILELIRLGFLIVPDLRFHPHIGTEATLSSVVRRIDSLKTGEVGQAVAEYVDIAESFSHVADLSERTSKIDSIRGAVERLYQVSGCPGAPVPHSVVYEDSGLLGIRELPRSTFEFGGVDRLFTLADILDDNQVPRALLRGFFLKLYGPEGRCPNVPAFLDAFKSELYNSYLGRDDSSIRREAVACDPWLRWGEAWRWDSARARLLDLVAAAPPEGGQVDIEEFMAPGGPVMELMPDVVFPFRHINLFAQIAEGGTLVVNNSFGGPGFGLSRFAHLFGGDGEKCVRSVEQLARSAGVSLHELLGGAAVTNLNLHGPLLDAELRMPGDPEGSRARRRTDIFDLDLIYRGSQQRLALVHRFSGEEVMPTYMGYLVPFATPTSHQLISLLAPPVTLGRGLWREEQPTNDLEQVKARPRVVIGNRIVVSRAAWDVPAGSIPAEDPTSPAGLVEWHRRWRSLGLPDLSYVTIKDSSSKRPKPRFYDTSSLLASATLAHEWRTRGGVLRVTEALPVPPLLDDTSKARVEEFIVGFSAIERTEEVI
jgi:hypothetical protein